jgi:hypothetical protein
MVPHVLVLPEDDANRQLANGFQLHHSVDTRRMQILEEAGGWHEVLERFKRDHIQDMQRYTNRFMVLLIDFDDRENRLQKVMEEVPPSLTDRVFVLGTLSEPEKLRQAVGTYEKIGLSLAADCQDNTETLWAHNLLKHNAGELERLKRFVRQILFPG